MADKAVFLDRDGTINVDKGYVHKPKDLEFEIGALEGLRALQNKGFDLVIITNQSGIGRGMFTAQDYSNFMIDFYNQLGLYDISIRADYFCPHKPEDSCECRKPKTKLILEAANDLGIDVSQSYAIGDKWADVKMGLDAGCKGAYLLNTGAAGTDVEHKVEAAERANSLSDAALKIMFREARGK
jgi:D,D-heptose 1,7-bisphosphate phosphatase